MPPPRLTGVVMALAAWGTGATAQDVRDPVTQMQPLQLRMSLTLEPLPRGEAARVLPIFVQARELSGRTDLETVAEGDAEFRRGALLLRADRLSYDHTEDLAVAKGHVRISQDGNVYTGPELQLKVQRFEGYFLQPTYFFGRTAAGGSAQRIDFIDDQRSVATGATYTSCPADGSVGPAWLLTTDRVRLNFDENEGIAEGAVLRFLGVPILGAPVLSFPLTEDRKSGWLPPSLNLDSRSGLQIAVPWYWNIAPQRDATLTPSYSSRRGAGLDTEFRYLEPRYQGKVNLNLLPNDQTVGRARYALKAAHDADLPRDTQLALRVLRTSDNEYWKDFPRALNNTTPRLLLSDLQASRPLGDDWTTYARVMRWQVLQNAENPITTPYERLPQIGARTRQRLGSGLEWSFEGEYNRFANPVNTLGPKRQAGSRVHALTSLSRPFTSPGWNLTPKLALNAASYSLEQAVNGSTSASRLIPTVSIDSAWVLERDANWFGRSVRQTLEPRLLYVNTPYREQRLLPNFDSSVKEFNFESIFSENIFSGVDRVSDANQLTAGVTTRLLDPATGAETLRLGLVQRYLFREQRVTPNDDVPFTRKVSDILLLGSTSVIPDWNLDASVQYSPDIKRTVRSIVGARFSPGPFRTVGATYRLARGLSEQVELGWQWPLSGQPRETSGTASGASITGAVAPSGSCRGAWYSVGRVNYSTRDSRITDSIVGFEYDAGCWIGRVVAERLSTGRSEATTRLLFQLELVGLSKLGSNPLQVLKDNIPGYRLLRDGPSAPAPTTFYD